MRECLDSSTGRGPNSGSTTAGPPLPHVSAIAIASQRRGEEANDDGDDGRATTSYFTAWQDGNATKHHTTVRKRNHGWQSSKTCGYHEFFMQLINGAFLMTDMSGPPTAR